MLCDSNILIYATDPADTLCVRFVERSDACIATISRIEVLGFPGWNALSTERRSQLRELVSSMIELPLNEAVIERAVVLRQQRKMSLGDAIVAATALVRNLALVTRNSDDFKHISGLSLINPFDAG